MNERGEIVAPGLRHRRVGRIDPLHRELHGFATSERAHGGARGEGALGVHACTSEHLILGYLGEEAEVHDRVLYRKVILGETVV